MSAIILESSQQDTAPLSTRAIVEAVTESLHQIARSLPPGEPNRVWTAAIKKVFRELGHQYAFEVCPDEDAMNGEWLYDLVWYRNDDQDRLIDVPLIVESEWSRSWFDIRYDFQKLLLAKSSVKIMIAQDGKHTVEELFSHFQEGVQSFGMKQPNEIYVFAVFSEDSYGFQIQTYPRVELPLIVES